MINSFTKKYFAIYATTAFRKKEKAKVDNYVLKMREDITPEVFKALMSTNS